MLATLTTFVTRCVEGKDWWRRCLVLILFSVFHVLWDEKTHWRRSQSIWTSDVIAQPPTLVDHPLTSDFIENPESPKINVVYFRGAVTFGILRYYLIGTRDLKNVWLQFLQHRTKCWCYCMYGYNDMVYTFSNSWLCIKIIQLKETYKLWVPMLLAYTNLLHSWSAIICQHNPVITWMEKEFIRREGSIPSEESTTVICCGEDQHVFLIHKEILKSKGKQSSDKTVLTFIPNSVIIVK